MPTVAYCTHLRIREGYLRYKAQLEKLQSPLAALSRESRLKRPTLHLLTAVYSVCIIN